MREGVFNILAVVRISHMEVAFAQAAAKLPLAVAVITRSTPPRLGNLDIVPGTETLKHGKWTVQPPHPPSPLISLQEIEVDK